MSYKKPDCHDNSCYFLTPDRRGGMRTNGGCFCFSNAGFDRSAMSSAIKILPELVHLREKVQELEETLTALKTKTLPL